MNNYPDDIRMFDNDPRSPFYVFKPQYASFDEAAQETVESGADLIEIVGNEEVNEFIGLALLYSDNRDEIEKLVNDFFGQARKALEIKLDGTYE
ncbi:hypothetical protein [Gayadomonas joobiniege]|uniref:hypothetical protein n=1 Tax=Gayadomonas joobiniege TaxID=1234606 RepID=UPI000372774B|nr:hypothetical protein [Gayadomonas joobiniege]